jgi:hypothetical protein
LIRVILVRHMRGVYLYLLQNKRPDGVPVDEKMRRAIRNYGERTHKTGLNWGTGGELNPDDFLAVGLELVQIIGDDAIEVDHDEQIVPGDVIPF